MKKPHEHEFGIKMKGIVFFECKHCRKAVAGWVNKTIFVSLDDLGIDYKDKNFWNKFLQKLEEKRGKPTK